LLRFRDRVYVLGFFIGAADSVFFIYVEHA
jgi:hypothetical protein